MTLTRKRYLTGDEVKALVAESDVGQGKQPWYTTSEDARDLLEVYGGRE